MKPEDICKVDYEGKQLAGTRKRTSEVLLHLAVYKNRPDVNAVVHCHPPHATAFAVAHEPIPKCVLPEVEVFLGEVPIAKYETPGDQQFADTIVPYVKDCNTILLANHGTVTFGPDLEKAYFNTRDHRRLLQDPDPGQAARPRQLLHASSRRASCWTSRSGSATTTRASQARTATCAATSIFGDGYGDFVPRAARLPRDGRSRAYVRRPAAARVRRRAARATAKRHGRAGADDHGPGDGGADGQRSNGRLRLSALASRRRCSRLTHRRGNIMKVSIIGGGGLVGSMTAYALQCGGVVSSICLIDANKDAGPGPGPRPAARRQPGRRPAHLRRRHERRRRRATSSSSPPACAASPTRAGSISSTATSICSWHSSTR